MNCENCGVATYGYPLCVKCERETLTGFLASRAGWLRVEAVDRPRGGFDVALRIDGTYAPDPRLKQEMVEYFREWLLPLLLEAGIDRLEGWNEPVVS